MCGRFAVTAPPRALRALFGFVEQPDFPPRYNIAPTQPVAIVREHRSEGIASIHFTLVRWGFLPSFVKDPADYPLVFNARAEGLVERASFRNASRRRRCLIPADAFYEWQRVGAGGSARSRPFMARRRDGETMGLAALWETWCGPNGEEIETACIITTAANAVSAAIHPRLPVVIERADWPLWLRSDELGTREALALLKAPGADTLDFVPVSEAVNTVARDGEEVQRPVGPPLAAGAKVEAAATQLRLL